MMVLVMVVFALRVTQTTIDRLREETTAREIDVEGCCCCCWSTQLI